MSDISNSKAWKVDLATNRLRALRKREKLSYLHVNFYNPPQSELVQPASPHIIDLREDLSCRERICHWTYSVVDHFQLSRETVAISINLFDRYFATKGNKCDADVALLASLTTLYIAIKVNERRKIKMCTLSELSRDKFSPQDIEAMEMKILTELSWLVHPPTSVSFIYELIKTMPSSIPATTRQDIFELTRYIAELSICDPFFIEQDSSSAALAALLNVLEDEVGHEVIPRETRTTILRDITTNFPWFVDNIDAVNDCRDRLRDLVWEQQNGSDDETVERPKRSVSPTSVTISITGKRCFTV
eukprot:CAMPEP_0204618164 /NCGR_PEP_ID=MMETSP0717-20131115/4906_1 /ASSEMBLY_ACC=CAM_ASM_000666 /TAXON_ID=230516 /ORGANISM="Chaetoceros curvisetus" /LENGTH=302 /DNA_ID=CAMNT_0051631851 /DNA_START=262 /DNA_END=1170 /DNA_ORIENTATION=+